MACATATTRFRLAQDETSTQTTSIDVVAAQMHDDASDPGDLHWDDLPEEQRHTWRQRARLVLEAVAENFEREADKTPFPGARIQFLALADRLRPPA